MMAGPLMVSDEALAQAGDVWMEADGVLLLCTVPGESWQDFTGRRVEWNAPLITRPLTRLIDPQGKPVGLAKAWYEGYEDGRDDECFSSHGLSIDSDAHEHPHANPYTKDGSE